MATMNNRSAKRVPGVPSPAYIESLYRTMAAALGPTGWWPAETTFEIMVGAVLTQNTAWGNVNRSLAALNAEGVLEPHKLAIMGPAHLQELIRPSGFYVNKSKTVQSLSRWYVERCGASPEGAADIPDAELRTELLGLFGIGGETADDLMLYVFSRRTFVADTYARRLFAFLGFDAPAGYLASTRPIRPWCWMRASASRICRNSMGSLTSSARPTAMTRPKASPFWVDGGLDCTANRSQ